jgi:signal transduction histidine kinase
LCQRPICFDRVGEELFENFKDNGSMKTMSEMKNIRRYWEDDVINRISAWHMQAVKSPLNRHVYILAGLLLLCIFQYYVDRTSLTDLAFFNNSFFTGIHDINRVLFLLPLVYAALVYRVRGSVIISVIFLIVVLPRAIWFSTYPNPIYRAVTFVMISGLIDVLISAGLNRIEKEKKDRLELDAAYQKLEDYTKKLEESRAQLLHADKLSSLGQLAASIAHEVNNPLSGILVYAQLMQKKFTAGALPKETALEYLAKMENELIRSTKLIRNLLAFSRQSPPSFKQTDINAVVTRAYELASDAAKHQKIKTVKELASSLPELTADADQLQQVCTNLILNAIQAMPEGGTLTLRTTFTDGWFKVEVRDTGHGISTENMDKLFTPFFTTKPEVKGAGLGLAISYGIIQKHRGRIEVQSREREGAAFTIYLPAHPEEEGDVEVGGSSI